MKPWEHMPLHKKAMEIKQLVDSIAEILLEAEMDYETVEEGEMIDNCFNFMVDNSLIIPAKIAEASSEDTVYDIKMENATLIRKAAIEIITDTYTLENFGFKDLEYLDVLRDELDTFRVLFAEWVNTFDYWNYHIDRWGLFNPPGINYDDIDPDEDLPFNPDDFTDN
ncbi:MAG: hypothetical protein R2812_07875 [Gelidibacter sp.]